MKNNIILSTLITILSFQSMADTYLGADQKKLFYKKHTAPSQKAVLIMTHGVLSHSEGYVPFIKKLNSNGYTVYRHDLRDHGKSRAKNSNSFAGISLVHIKEFDTYLKDFSLLVERVRAENPNSPIYLFGHSMGGLISYLHSVEDTSIKISGLILSAPALSIKVVDWKRHTKLPLAKALEDIKPTTPVFEYIAARDLTDDPASQKIIDNDPLRVDQLTIKLALEMLKASYKAQGYIFGEAPIPPLFLIQGDKDPRVIPENNRSFAVNNRLLGRPTKISYLKGVFHEPLKAKKEIRDSVEDDIILFMNEVIHKD